jgi:uncharacterized protein YbjT (DUF2867 family)
MTYLIYGATGLIGSEVVRQLVFKGENVIACTRKAADKKQDTHLKWISVDAAHPEKGTEYLELTDRLFLMAPTGNLDQFKLLKPWIDKAKQYSVKKIVLMTAMGLEHAPPEIPFKKLENYLAESGIEYIILRPNWFMQNFQTMWLDGIKNNKKIYFPGGDAKVSFIHTDDIANSILGAFNNIEEKNRAFLLTGREAINHFEVTQILSKIIKSDISYIDISNEDFMLILSSAGFSEEYAAFLGHIAKDLKESKSIAITGDVKYLTGKEPIKFAEYAESNALIWE